MVEATNGRYIEGNDLNELFPILIGIGGLSTTPRASSIVLQLSNTISISCKHWNRVSKSSFPSLKKLSKISHEYDNVKGDGGNVVKRDTSYRNPDDPDEEIRPEEKVKGFKYGPQYIPITPNEEEAFMIMSSPIIEIIGFIDHMKIPRYHFLDCHSVLVGDESQTGAIEIMSSLSKSLQRKQQVALVRFVKRENGEPILSVLIPITHTPGEFIIYRIPCCDDVRDYPFPSLPTPYDDKPESELKKFRQKCQLMSKLVKQMTITEEKLNLSHFVVFNPALKRLYHSLIQKINCHTESSLPFFSSSNCFANPFLSEISEQYNRGGVDHNAINEILSFFNEVFELKRIEKKSKKRGFETNAFHDDIEKKQKKTIEVNVIHHNVTLNVIDLIITLDFD
jgi:hypothetical protein